MPIKSKSEQQLVEEAQRLLDVRLGKLRKLEDRGRYVVASLILRAAEDDPALACRIREIVDHGVKKDRDRAAVDSVLGHLHKTTGHG